MARLPEAEGWRCVGEVRFTGRAGHASKVRFPGAPQPIAFTPCAACDPRDLDCFRVRDTATNRPVSRALLLLGLAAIFS